MGSPSKPRDPSRYGVARNDILGTWVSIKKELDTRDPHRSRRFELQQNAGLILNCEILRESSGVTFTLAITGMYRTA